MRKYEAVFIFLPHLEEEVRTQLFNRLKSIMGEDNVLDVDEWGV